MNVLTRTAAAAAALSVLLTWLLLHSAPKDVESFEVSRALDALAISEAMVHSDVLSARVGLLQDYDALVQSVQGMRRSTARLTMITHGLAEDQMRKIQAEVAREEDLTEQFKSDNAVLQNALAYFDLLSARVEDPATDPRLSVELGSLTQDLMHLTRNASPDVVRSITARLDQLAAKSLPPELAEDVATFVMQGRLLSDRLPKVNDVLHRLVATSTAAERETIAARSAKRRIAQEACASRYRVALYLVALALLLLLLRFGLRLRQGALVLRARADLEHLVAEVSTRFIACQPEEIEAQLGSALGTLGEVTEANRVYVLLPGDPEPVRLWSRPGLVTPCGWPEALFEVMPVIAAADGVSMRVWRMSNQVPSQVMEKLAAFEVPGWSCAKLFREDQFIGVLCYDRSASPPVWLNETVGLLRMTATVISNALLRQHHFIERRALEARLQHAQRLERVGIFTSGVAHNFNNVIGAMMGHAEMASDRLDVGTEPARHVEEIIKAGERARELVGQILDFGRGGDTLRRPVSVGSLVAEAVSQARASLPPQFDLVVTGDEGDAFVMGEPAQLQQVLVNLIRNGAQASDPSGRITVDVGQKSVAKLAMLSHGVLTPNLYIRLRVIDEGCGIDAGTLSEIFRPFFTTRPAGTGLGLATASEVVRDAGGAFHVRSAPGSGSTFEVYLPVIVPRDRSETTPRGGRGETIMIVGAELSIIMRDEEMLAALGYEPVAFVSPEAALAAAQNGPGRFDAAIVEVALPNASGLDLALELRKSLPGRAIILSSNSPEALPSDALAAARIVDILRRPWRSSTVASVLARSIRGGVPAAATGRLVH